MKTHHIHAIKAFEDNYIWVIENGEQAAIIDPGSADELLDFLDSRGLGVEAILITHHHDDHTGGVAKLQSIYKNCTLYAHDAHGLSDFIAVNEGSKFNVLGLDFTVWLTNGHTDSHLSYLTKIDGVTRVFCGDTLFSGGCGRVFTGTIESLRQSFERYLTLDEGAMFYPAHEYTLSNLRFAKTVASEDKLPHILNAYDSVSRIIETDGISLPVFLSDEKQCNVFLHACDPDTAKAIAMKNGLTNSEPLSVFAWLRQAKNEF